MPHACLRYILPTLHALCSYLGMAVQVVTSELVQSSFPQHQKTDLLNIVTLLAHPPAAAHLPAAAHPTHPPAARPIRPPAARRIRPPAAPARPLPAAPARPQPAPPRLCPQCQSASRTCPSFLPCAECAQLWLQPTLEGLNFSCRSFCRVVVPPTPQKYKVGSMWDMCSMRQL